MEPGIIPRLVELPLLDGGSDVHTFKQVVRKSSVPPRNTEGAEWVPDTVPKNAYLNFTSEILNGQTISAKVDTLLLTPAHVAQEKQAK